jgi:hypothetical protein
MAIFSAEERHEISAALNSRGINRPCPACGKWDITIVDGYVKHVLYSRDNPNAGTVGDANITCIAISCNNCGLLSHYTLQGLGLPWS